MNSEFAAAVALHRLGDIEGAIAAYRRILEVEPDHPDVTSSLGIALQAGGRKAEGLDLLRSGAAAHPGHEDLNYNFGNALRDAEELEAALAHYRRVLDGNADHLGAALNLGLCLERLQRLDAAVEHYRQVLLRHPEQAEIYHNLGAVLWLQRKLEVADACYRRAVALKADYPQAYFNLGLTLDALGRYGEGEAAFRLALKYQPALVDALSGLGQNLLNQGRPDDAREWFETALAHDPEHLDAHLGRVRGNLLAGELEAGWAEFGWHRKRDSWQAPDVSGVAWAGEDIDGKTVLLFGEEGLGDIIHFSRFARLVARRGGRVHVYCPKPLVRLLQTLDGVGSVIGQDQPAPATDLICSLIDLPKIFGTNLQTIARVCPYLRPPTEHGPQARTAGPLRVGMVWGGNPNHQRDRDRSCPLISFAPLLAVPGVELMSLQVGPAAAEIKTSGFDGLIPDVGSRLTDFAHTADVLSQLDLLITVDTAIAHLAGALGFPVWTLLAFAPDWRWMLKRPETPWYPTMKLYRQPAPHDWEGVVSRLEAELRTLVRNRTRHHDMI